MNRPELLVHVTAPGRVQDDRKYLSITQSIIDFRAITLFKIAPETGNGQPGSSPYHDSEPALCKLSGQPQQENVIASEQVTPLYGDDVAAHSMARTPDQPLRPATAPETVSPPVQVPRTDTVHRRTISDPLSFCSFPSCVPDSQLRADGSVESLQVPDPCIDPREECEFLATGNIFSANQARRYMESDPGEEPCRKRRRPTHPTNDYDVTFRTERKEDSNMSRSAFFKTTVTRSNEVIDPCHDSGHQDNQKALDSQTVTIQTGSSGDFYARIRSLPVKVEPPLPSVGQGLFTTHITTNLQILANRLGFERFFRPINVKRDIKVLERGYWLMHVTVAPDETVATARKGPSSEHRRHAFEKRFSGATAEERVEKYLEWSKTKEQDPEWHVYDYGYEENAKGLWTEREFVNFWENFSTFLKNGKAGWGTRMVRDEDGIGCDGKLLKTTVRIYTWGEVLAHVWLAIWVLSDKVSERIAMKWIAGDGTTIVEMAGSHSGRGKLAPWCRKGGEGEQGCWGLAETRT